MRMPKPTRLPSGNWRVQLLINGKRLSKTFETEEAARIWAQSYKETHRTTIRKDPFFYRCDGGLCYDYLKKMEEAYNSN